MNRLSIKAGFVNLSVWPAKIGPTPMFLSRSASGLRRRLLITAAWSAAALAMTFASTANAAPAERRVAFVVGNSNYSSVPQLNNPDDDARAVAAALKKEGFEVVSALDLDRAGFDKAFEKFIRSLGGAQLSVFYYSGHGIQVAGDNRIIPIDAKLTDPADLEVETINVKTIMSFMQQNSKAQLIYLDSCRNNPFPSREFLVGPEKQVAVAGVGLAPLTADISNLIAYSTQPGAVAVDGTGDKSPFTESMLKYSFKLGVDVQKALDNVTDEVFEKTNKQQKPWSANSLAQPVYLARPAIRIAAMAPATQTAATSVKITPAVRGTQPAADAPDPAQVQVASWLSDALTKPRRIPIGVGQVAMLGDLPIVRAATGAEIEIVTAPKAGTMYLDGKALVEGDVVDQTAVRNITFEPSIGSENLVQDVQFKLSQAGAANTVAGKIEPFMTACDEQAGEPLDPQGVSAGKLPNEIDAPAAIASCDQAIAEYPTIPRYKYQLGRAKLAAKDVAAATNLFQAAADAGHTRAYYELGYLAQRGLGRTQDLNEANRLFKQGSDLGDPYAMLSYGRNLARGRGIAQDKEGGIQLLNKAVELGHTYAMNALGAMYYYGDNLPANPKRGVRFYEASLARGDIYAMHNMGIAYLEGKGVDQDAATAMALFKKASDGGHPSAPTSIGAMYFNGNGVKKSLKTAVEWYQIATERGDHQAASNLGWIYSQGPKDFRNGPDAVWFSSLAVALDYFGDNKAAADNLAKLPEKDKKATMKRLMVELDGDAETAETLDGTLVLMARKAWQKRNPRLDLF